MDVIEIPDDREHSRLGASSAKRVMACPYSLRNCEHGEPFSPPSTYAAEGTVGHHLGEHILKAWEANGFQKHPLCQSFFSPGQAFKVGDIVYELGSEMIEAVNAYVTVIRDIAELEAGPDASHRTEVQLYMKELEGAWTYIDHGIVSADKKTVWVQDLKLGFQEVECEDNDQLLYACACSLVLPVEVFHVAIIQPLAGSGPVAIAHTYTRAEVEAWQEQYLNAVHQALNTTMPLEPCAGDHCQYCPVKASCAGKLRVYQAMTEVVTGKPTLPSVDTLDDKKIAFIVEHAAEVKKWIDQVEALARDRIENGSGVRGLEVKPGKKLARQWNPGAEQALKAQFGDAIYDRKLKTVSAVEKEVGSAALESSFSRFIRQGFSKSKLVRAVEGSDPLDLL